MNEPKAKFSAGPVSCAIWANDAVVNGRSVQILRATVERRYTDKSGSWKSSGSFSKTEIPQVVYCLIKAYATMIEGGTKGQDGTV